MLYKDNILQPQVRTPSSILSGELENYSGLTVEFAVFIKGALPLPRSAMTDRMLGIHVYTATNLRGKERLSSLYIQSRDME